MTTTQRLRRVREGVDVFMLWHSGYYDGPLDGVCVLDGEHYWFKAVDMDWCSREWRIYPMLPGEFDAESARHEDFATTVGRHTGYIYEGTTRMRADWFNSAAKPDWRGYYERPHDPPPKVDDRSPVAWFGRTPHRWRERSHRYFEHRQEAAA